MSLSILSNASNNESDFFKRMFADFKTLEPQSQGQKIGKRSWD